MRLNFQFMLQAFPDILSYLPVTVQLTVGALAIAFPFAFIFALVLIKKVPVVTGIVKVYVSIIRGTPIILQIFIIYNLMPSVLNVYFTATGADVNIFGIDNKYYAYLALSLSATAFLTEAFRAAIAGIDKGQLEAAYMVGMNGVSAYKRIVLPQALGVALPIIYNTVADTIKATSLAFAMSVTEVTGRAKILGGQSLNYFEAYLDIFLVYIIFIGIVEYLLKKLESKVKKYQR